MTSFSGNFCYGGLVYLVSKKQVSSQRTEFTIPEHFLSTISAYSQNCRLGSTISLLSELQITSPGLSKQLHTASVKWKPLDPDKLKAIYDGTMFED